MEMLGFMLDPTLPGVEAADLAARTFGSVSVGRHGVRAGWLIPRKSDMTKGNAAAADSEAGLLLDIMRGRRGMQKFSPEGLLAAIPHEKIAKIIEALIDDAVEKPSMAKLAMIKDWLKEILKYTQPKITADVGGDIENMTEEQTEELIRDLVEQMKGEHGTD
jgi:hypothetical protein